MRPGWVVALVLLAGCTSAPEMPPCRNEQPRGADCSYDITGLTASARFDERYDAERAAAALRELGFDVRLANANAVLAGAPDGLNATVEAREGWFWLVLGIDVEGTSGLTYEEVQAEGRARCNAGPGARMTAALEGFERITGWARAAWEPCRANGGVA